MSQRLVISRGNIIVSNEEQSSEKIIFNCMLLQNE